MNKSLIVGLAAGAVVAAGAAAVASYKHFSEPDYARVVNIKPVEKTIRTPREVCHDETLTQQAPVKDRKQVAGTAIGAVVGGVIGHQIGDGNGQKVATAAGAAAGGYAGNRVQKHIQDGRTVTTTQQRCETVYDTHIERHGFDVRYQVGDQEGTVRMDHDPGDRIPLRQGRLVLDTQAGQG